MATPPIANTLPVSATPDPTPFLTSPPLPSGTVTFAFTGYADAALLAQGCTREFTETRTHNRLMALVSEKLAPGDLARLLAEGAALSPQAAIALALAEP